MSSAALAAAAPTPPRKTLWETIFTSTPVLLTVMATILAGLSSSEMTQAQYHRSLAAQYQSKAGDQWGFFQAKRIRGSALENAADHLPPTAPLDPARLKASAHQLTLALEQAAKSGREPDAVAKRIM